VIDDEVTHRNPLCSEHDPGSQAFASLYEPAMVFGASGPE
jgi:hypothetical protein